jgi:hypothetical protein
MNNRQGYEAFKFWVEIMMGLLLMNHIILLFIISYHIFN